MILIVLSHQYFYERHQGTHTPELHWMLIFQFLSVQENGVLLISPDWNWLIVPEGLVNKNGKCGIFPSSFEAWKEEFTVRQQRLFHRNDSIVQAHEHVCVVRIRLLTEDDFQKIVGFVNYRILKFELKTCLNNVPQTKVLRNFKATMSCKQIVLFEVVQARFVILVFFIKQFSQVGFLCFEWRLRFRSLKHIC